MGQLTDIKIGGLLFSGILIASLGAVMDVAMSVSSAISEIHDKAPELSSVELFKSGMNVGRDMMGTMSNTLILAFVGSAVSELVINYAYNLPFRQIINSYVIGNFNRIPCYIKGTMCQSAHLCEAVVCRK